MEFLGESLNISVNSALRLVFCCHEDCQTYIHPDVIRKHFRHINHTRENPPVNVSLLCRELTKRNIPLSTKGEHESWWEEITRTYLNPSEDPINPLPGIQVYEGFRCLCCTNRDNMFCTTSMRRIYDHHRINHKGQLVKASSVHVQALFHWRHYRKFFPVKSPSSTETAPSTQQQAQDAANPLVTRDKVKAELERILGQSSNTSERHKHDKIEARFGWQKIVSNLGITKEDAIDLIQTAAEAEIAQEDVSDDEVDQGQYYIRN